MTHPAKRAKRPAILASCAVFLAVNVSAMAQERPPQAQLRSTLSPAELTARAIHRRAIEAIIWGMPAVNFELLYQATAQAKGSWNQIVYWSRLPDWKNQTLTPNPDTIYVFPFFNTKDARPMALEIPPAGEGSITGSVDDAWQTLAAVLAAVSTAQAQVAPQPPAGSSIPVTPDNFVRRRSLGRQS